MEKEEEEGEEKKKKRENKKVRSLRKTSEPSMTMPISWRTVPGPTFFMERTATSLARRVLDLSRSSRSSRAEIKDTDRSRYTGKDRGWSKMGTWALWADALGSP